MRKATHHLDDVDSSNPHCWRGKQLHHHGGGICWLFVLLWIDSWHHKLIVCKKWYTNKLKMRLAALLFDLRMCAPYQKIDQWVITKTRLCISQSSPLSPKTHAWLLVSKLIACVTSFALNWETIFFLLRLFPHWAMLIFHSWGQVM